VPPADFVDRLCQGRYLSVAIYMFEKSTPWTRMYVKPAGGVDASNTQGGPTGDTRLAFGEEVLILRQQGGGTGGMQVSGSGGYFVLRWDGTCSTVSDYEVVSYQPGVLRNAPFEWKFVEPALQEALLQDPAIDQARKEHRKQCQGRSTTTGASPCAQATNQLLKTITSRLRKGVTLPRPAKLP
jgi:hypothetical protein